MAAIGEAVPAEEKKSSAVKYDRTNNEAKQMDFFRKALQQGMEAFNIPGGNDDPNDDLAEDRSISHSTVSYTSMQGSGLMKT